MQVEKTNHVPRYDIQTEYKFIYSNNGGQKVAEYCLQNAQRKLLSTYNCEPYNTVFQNQGEIKTFSTEIIQPKSELRDPHWYLLKDVLRKEKKWAPGWLRCVNAQLLISA